MEKTFDEIAASIAKELATLRTINNSQRKEIDKLRATNEELRKEIAELRGITLNEVGQPSEFEYIMTNIYTRWYSNTRFTILRVCKPLNITKISDFEGRKADDLLKLRGLGKPAIGTLCAICLHYGIDLYPSPELKADNDFSKYFNNYSKNAVYPE